MQKNTTKNNNNPKQSHTHRHTLGHAHINIVQPMFHSFISYMDSKVPLQCELYDYGYIYKGNETKQS